MGVCGWRQCQRLLWHPGVNELFIFSTFFLHYPPIIFQLSSPNICLFEVFIWTNRILKCFLKLFEFRGGPSHSAFRGLANMLGWVVTICTELNCKSFVKSYANVSDGAVRYYCACVHQMPLSPRWTFSSHKMWCNMCGAIFFCFTSLRIAIITQALFSLVRL